MHFIIAGYFSQIEIQKGFKKAVNNFSSPPAILSFINMYKEHCITKEKYEEMYQTNEERPDKRPDLSVGEDLETFIERIKNGEINKDTISTDGDSGYTFLLCLLDKDERKKLEQNDYDFMSTFEENLLGIADVPEAEWKASEFNMKFARSGCYRETYFIDA